MEGIQKFRHNVMGVTNLKAFESVKGGVNNNCKDVYFVRAIGVNAALLKDIKNMDTDLTNLMNEGKGYYNRIHELPKLIGIDDTAYYTDCYNNWVANSKQQVETKATRKAPALKHMLGKACAEVEKLYFKDAKNSSDSIRKNLIAKLLFWYDFVFLDDKLHWTEKMSAKIVFQNITKKQEYLFCYLITLMGCDVLLLQSSSDIDAQMQALKISETFEIGGKEDILIPQYVWRAKEASKELPEEQPKEQPQMQNKGFEVSQRVTLQIPERNSRRQGREGSTAVRNQTETSNADRREKSFEELAQLASSVVLIAVHDADGEVIGTGSGIMIGRDGYILTNNHVASGGRYYSVRIEEDDKVYTTDEVIKYHSVLDLAIIRIQRQLHPLPVYQGSKKLVRGQKVVAIGSPLGLFNSVSDGIISGFRVIDQVDMIQFTAPTSHGSSGGAVLNMYGEVIGISTAGIESGQNINLAVGYECINMFIKGFVNKNN